MFQWKFPFSNKWVHQAICLALGTVLLIPALPLSASAQSALASESTLHASIDESASEAYRHGRKHGQGSSLEVGQSRVLHGKEIRKEWGGIDRDYSPEQAVKAVKAAIPQKDYEELFPYRLGSAEWHKAAQGKEYYRADQTDYFSYANFIAAVTEAANIKYKVSYRKGSLTAQEILRLDKTTGKETLVARSSDFSSRENRNKRIETEIVDYGTFLKEGSVTDRKRELAALFANLAHETGGGWDTAPGGPLRWGLFWNENIAGRTGQNPSPFVDPASSELYPGFPGKRYYGRGPIMLSWNFNYGLFSSVIYGDKNVLLQNPELVAQDGKVGFMTAILFWMTPQAPKPSAHDVMAGKWRPSREERAKGLTPAGFGITIMVLNGLEANLGETDGSPVKRRAGHYRDITAKLGVDITGEKVDTLGMQPF
ncbi:MULTISPECIES: chitinase [Paenibacillus]|uniref:chitinase n=1 Tax=Paenibacillus TaxID=44249 RepID=UPI0022B86670|nr:chitinase [Paenibacillus caseinilyticus]MCZ8520410.1 chitinase [Paenibacillus caseinilyticus]